MISENTSNVADAENIQTSEPQRLADGHDEDGNCVEVQQQRPPRLLLLQFVKSVLSMNPCMVSIK